MSNTTQIREGEILPGLNLDKFISHGVDSGKDLSSKEYTAENLLRNHPDKYGIAARLIFAGVSKRFICEVVKISNRTVNAIELRESQTRGAEILQNRIETKRRKLALLLTQHLEDLLSSEETIKKLGVDDLLRLIDRLSPEQSNQKSSSSKRESGQDPIDVEPIEPRDPSVEAYAKIYRLDGLEAEKNPAARVDVSSDVSRVVSPAANPAVSQAASPAADGSSVSQDANQGVDSVRESTGHSVAQMQKESQLQMQNIFISRLKELQGENSVSAFARYLELPQNTVDCYVKGRRKPSVELILRVCKKCGVTADWLLGLSETRTPLNVAAPTRVLPIKPRKNPFAADTDLLTEIAAMKRRMQELEAIAIKQLDQGAACCG